MPFSPKTIEEKPYNMCIDCIHIGKDCDGANFLAMDTDRWCEWCHLRKEYLGWTNAHVAELSGIAKVSVDRIMAGNVKDLRISTMQAVTKALVNGSWGQYPCAMASDQETVYVDNPDLVDKLNKADAECKRLQAVLDRINDERKADVAAAHLDDKVKIDFLKEQLHFQEAQLTNKDRLLNERYEFLKRKDRTIAILSILLVIAVLTIIIALVVDRTNPDLGYFWREAKAAFEAHNTTWKV